MDIHELLKQIIADEKINVKEKKVKIIGLFHYINSYKIRKSLVPASNLRTNHLILDSGARVPSTDLYSISWIYNWNSIYQNGTVTTKIPIRNIRAIRIYSLHAFTQVTLDNSIDDLLTILINEFKAQSIIGHGFNYHFVLRKSKSNPITQHRYDDGIIYTEEYVPTNDGIYYFNDLFTVLNSLTITMTYAGYKSIIPLSYNATTCNYFSATNPTIFTSHKNIYKIGDVLQIFNFTTTDSVKDINQINALNSIQGHIVRNVVYSSNTWLVTLDVDLSTISPTRTYDVVLVLNNANHSYFALDVIYVETDENTPND